MAIDTDGVPVIETGGPPPRRRPLSPLWLLLGALVLLAIGGVYVWQRHTVSEADAVPLVTAPDASRPSALASGAPIPPGAPKNAVTRNTAVTPLAITAPIKSDEAKPARVPPALPRTTVAALPAPADRRTSQLRKTLEGNGWSVYWLGSTGRVSAWKSEGKTGYEVRLTRGAQQATVLKTGGRNVILRKWTVTLPTEPTLRGGRLYANSATLLRGALAHE